MVEVYVSLILKGLKTVDDVPEILKSKVIKQLEALDIPVAK